jgi:hypothetical protein
MGSDSERNETESAALKSTEESPQRKSRTLALSFSGREALWTAVLLHLIILLLPQSFNPFTWFQVEYEQVPPEPIAMNFTQPVPEPETEITDQPENQRAITPERSEAEPETDQPTIRGETNLRALETPPRQMRESSPSSRPENVRETGEQRAEPTPQQPDPRDALEEAEARERSRLLAEALEEGPEVEPSDFPILYDNEKPSGAEYSEGMIQFDTYNWNYEPYRARMLRKIYVNWVPKLRTISYFLLGRPGLTVFRFRIQADGSVTQLQLLRPAQYPNYDRAADYAIMAPYWSMITPFPPLPANFPEKDLGVTIGFYVNMEPPSRNR